MDCLGNLSRCKARCCKVLVYWHKSPPEYVLREPLKHWLLMNPTQDLIYYYQLHGVKVERKNREIYQVLFPEGVKWKVEKVTETMYRIIAEMECTALTAEDLCSLHGTEEKPRLCRRFDENHTEGYYIPEKCVLNNSRKT